MKDNALELLAERAREYGITLTSGELRRFSMFCDYLLEQGAIHNLTAIKDDMGVAIKHFADSLAIAPFLRELSYMAKRPEDDTLASSDRTPSSPVAAPAASDRAPFSPAASSDRTPSSPVAAPALPERHVPTVRRIRVMDVGSGAGIPAIPLKIILGDCAEVTAVDSTKKKVRFAGEAAKRLELAGFEAIWARAEALAKEPARREAYDVVIARAVAPLNRLLGYLAPFARRGGAIVAMKARKEAVEAELADAAAALASLARSGFGAPRVSSYALKDADGTPLERAVVIIKKQPQ